MTRITNLVGQRFGRLTALRQNGFVDGLNGNKTALWVCKCDCGNIVEVSREDLYRGKKLSCGCARDRIGNYAYQFWLTHESEIKEDWKQFSRFVNLLPHAHEAGYKLSVLDPTKPLTKYNVVWCKKSHFIVKRPRKPEDYKAPLWAFLKGFITLAGFSSLNELSKYTDCGINALKLLKSNDFMFISDKTLKDIANTCSMSDEDLKIAYELLDSARKNLEFDTYRGSKDLVKKRVKLLLEYLDPEEQKEFIKELQADAAI